MPDKVTTFLLFEGRAEEAINFYTATFVGATIKSMARYGAEGPGVEGSVMHAVIDIAGTELAFTDSAIPHDFTFTPSISLFVECATEEELDKLFADLSADGEVKMPLNNYGFSRKFAWVADRFGVSWQINLA